MMEDTGIQTGHIQRDAARTVGICMISLSDRGRSVAYSLGQSATQRLADDPAHAACAIADLDLVVLPRVTLAIQDAPKALLEVFPNARDVGQTIIFDLDGPSKRWLDSATVPTAMTAGIRVKISGWNSFEKEAAYFGESGKVAPGPAVTVVNATSAADSLNAGLLARLRLAMEAIMLACSVTHQVIGQTVARMTLTSNERASQTSREIIA